MKKFLKMLFFCIFISFSSFAQYSVSNKKAIKLYQKAEKYFREYKTDEAIKECEKSLEISENFVEPYLLMAQIFHEKKDVEKEIEMYRKAVKINGFFYPYTYYFLAESEYFAAKYEDAFSNFENFLNGQKDTIYRKKAQFYLKCCEFAVYSQKNPVSFVPQNLGKNINSKYDDYWVSLTADEEKMILTSNVPLDSLNLNSRQEDFYESVKKNETWLPRRNVGSPMNTTDNEGAQTLSADGKTMIFTICNKKNGFGSCDLYISFLKNQKWTTPQNLGKPVNTEFWESQPSLSADGKTLYFVSNRKNGKGGMDIWKTQLNEKNEWTNPENLGDSINTAKNEMSPFIHFDSKTLYFSSNGHIGMGGMDVYVSRKNLKNEFSIPQNLGFPINTEKDEVGFVVNLAGNFAYFSSDRIKGFGGKDIYAFELPKSLQPTPSTYVKGKVFDAETQEFLKAECFLINLKTRDTVFHSQSNENGEFLVCLPVFCEYAFQVSHPSYLFFSEHFSLPEFQDVKKHFLIKAPLAKVKIGEKIILKNVFFETDSYVLKPESQVELNKLIDFLKKNLNRKVEIGGHTDNVGSEEHNKNLSQNRANSVVNYLVKNGIDAKRLSAKGYGFSEPIAENNTTEGKALNRRTECKIIE